MAAHVEGKPRTEKFKPLSEADIALTNRYSAGACTGADVALLAGNSLHTERSGSAVL